MCNGNAGSAFQEFRIQKNTAGLAVFGGFLRKG